MFVKNSVFALILAAAASTCYGLSMGYGMGYAPCAQYYTVRLGDTCNKICQEQHVSTYQLLTTNAGLIKPDCSNLRPGEVICLYNVGQRCSPVYTVVPGDTCQKVADKNHITLQALLARNPNIDAKCDNLDAGEVLCVAAAFNLVSQSDVYDRYSHGAGGCGAV